MCGRIVIARCELDLKKFTKINKNMTNSIYYKESYNQTPGNYLPTIYRTCKNKNIEYNLEAMSWGIKNKKLSYLLFNSRLDSIEIYPFYKDYNRCVIIIEGYYEWDKKDKNKPYFITAKNTENNIIYLAGLYKSEIDEIGFEYKSMTIITTEANKDINFIHDRMPIIFNKHQQAIDYLNGISIKKIMDKNLEMKFFLVGDLVNNLNNISKDNIIPRDEINYNKNGNLLIKNFFKKEIDKNGKEKFVLSKKDENIKINSNLNKNLNKIKILENNKNKNLSDDDKSLISTTVNSEFKSNIKKNYGKSFINYKNITNFKNDKCSKKNDNKINKKILFNFITKK